MTITKVAFRYSLSVLKIYSVRNVYYRFSVLAVNIETQPKLSVIIIFAEILKNEHVVISRENGSNI